MKKLILVLFLMLSGNALADKCDDGTHDMTIVIKGITAKVWIKNGQRHRIGCPAMMLAEGSKVWYLNGQLHRTNGPAIELADGSKVWYLFDKKHRSDGPAVEFANGTKVWFLLNILHRSDGPAIEDADGTKEWYLNGKKLTEEEFNKRTKQ